MSISIHCIICPFFIDGHICNYADILNKWPFMCCNRIHDWIHLGRHSIFSIQNTLHDPVETRTQTLRTDTVLLYLLILYFLYCLFCSLYKRKVYDYKFVNCFSYPRRAGYWAGDGYDPQWGLSALILGSCPHSEMPLWRSARPPRGASARRLKGPESLHAPQAGRSPHQRRKRLQSALERDTGTLFDGCFLN